MKKWLSIIGTIGLTATSTTTLISCKKENNNENGGEDNKPEPQYNPQQPPEGSNWKLIPLDKLNNNPDNKWYIGIVKKKQNDNFSVIKFNFSNKSIWDNSGVPYHIINGVWYLFKSYYCWNGNDEPETPTIDKNTGEITDWKEQKGTE
ncbi:lipoprotein [Spiroplasma citri]|uniref:lipoprotein n=1 Tax=Spiroplasma citri TaxID=2133 RepID=UPI000903C430|nr:lipoprotein [Spiroplasma citri]APE75551.1 plectrovirus-related protein [Spiroplasma citri]